MKKIKKIITGLLAIASMTTFVSCEILGGEKDADEYEIVLGDGKSTETTAEYDNTYFGLYKGIINGPKSSGTIKIEINNGNDETKAFIQIGDKTEVLNYTRAYQFNETTNMTDEYTSPEPLPQITRTEDRENFLYPNPHVFFSGASSSFDVDLYTVTENGKKTYLCHIQMIEVEGHENLKVVMRKESSDNKVTCFQGTSADSKGNKGVFNMIHTRNNPIHWVHSGEAIGMNAESSLGYLDGSLFDENESLVTYTDLDEISIENTYKFKLNDNNISGTWKAKWNGGSNEGTVTCDVPIRKIK